MATTDPRIDAYIARAAPFARPVLKHIRALVHRAVPGVEESIKWGMPHFLHHGMLCGMAAFKAHCTMSFWKGALVLPEAARKHTWTKFRPIISASRPWRTRSGSSRRS